MYLPFAFIDTARQITMSDSLGFLTLGPAMLDKHPEAAALVRGWAELVDRVVEEAGDRALVVEDDKRAFFDGMKMRAAIAEVGTALAALTANELPALELSPNETPANALEAARRFVAGAEKIATALDAVRAPSFRALWTGAPAEHAPFGALPFPLARSEAKDGAVLVGGAPISRLELRRGGLPVQILEVDVTARAGQVLRIEAFSSPPGRSDADREVALYDWVDAQVETMHAALEPRPRAFVCSFCEKTQKEVKKLIAGPSVFICNECVGMCAEVVAAEG